MEDNFFTSLGASGLAGSATTAGISALAGVGGSLLSGAIGNMFGKKSRRDAADVSYNQYLRQLAADYNYQNGKGFELAQKYDNKNFALARRYSENSASWARRGLEKAGLNPILAASQGFNANMGSAGVGPSSGGSLPSVDASIPRFDVAESARDFAGMAVQANSARKLAADVDVSKATAENIEAQTLRTLVDAYNESRHQGVTGWPSLLSQFMNDADGSTTFKDRSKFYDLARSFMKNKNAVHALGKMAGFSDDVKDVSTAKDIDKAIDNHIDAVIVPPKSVDDYWQQGKLMFEKFSNKMNDWYKDNKHMSLGW